MLGGDALCRIGAVLTFASAVAIVYDVARLEIVFVILALASMSSSFLAWILARLRFGVLNSARSNPSRRSAQTSLVALLFVTSLLCLILSIA